MTVQAPADPTRSNRPLGSRLRNGTGCLLILALAGLSLAWLLRDNPEHLLQAAARAFALRDYPLAERLAVRALASQSEHAAAALQAGRAAEAQGHFEAALDYFELVPDQASQVAVMARVHAGEVLSTKLKRLSAATSQYQRALVLDPDNPVANDRLAYLLGLGGNHREATPLRLKLIRQHQFGPIHLLLLCMGDFLFENPEQIEEFRVSVPDDPLVLTALARDALDKQQPGRAVELLRPVALAHPELLDTQVKLGQALLELHDDAAFLKWHADLPTSIELFPGIWFLRAGWARSHGDQSGAVRCYLETLYRDPNHQAANYHLAQLLQLLGQAQQAASFLDRSQKLQKFDTAVRAAWSGGGEEHAMRQAAEVAESLGLIWEASGWNRLARQKFPQASWARSGVQRLETQLAGLPLTRTRPGMNPAEKLDRTRYPLPNWATNPAPLQTTAKHNNQTQSSPIAFANQAAKVGLNFQYFNSSDPLRPDRKMQEFTGGGVTVLDLDADGWPDVHLTQGCAWPYRSDNFQHVDRLFRNLGREAFQDVTALANLSENGFSQGATAGDFDNDGFPDLYICNIGGNRFYRNNGDGTFDDITEQSDTAGDRWSSSCLLADLNRDGLPDLYVVNYLAGSEVLERICQDASGHSRSCMPRIYSAAQDQLYVNLGDGRFQDVTDASGIIVPDGKGLGIVAADFDGSGQLNLFVANDAVPNFYFVNRTPPGGAIPLFAEQGIASGLALNQDGRAQACMGVAVGNLDNDQRLSLFVTNFHDEPNTLYHQQSAGVFTDDTRSWGLYEASIPMVGFGTQFLDADLDGFLDLVLTNGDVDDSRDLGRQYQMPPQFFRNGGRGSFTELSANTLGPYFSGKYLGRGLARLDWNRDGRDDILVSHLDAPAALLTNTTEATGHFVAIQLRAVTTSRDAIGTTVSVTTKARNFVRQLVAGDGYYASNERQLSLGLGDAEQITELSVSWPSGRKQVFRNVPIDSRILIVEDQPRAFSIQH